MGARILVADDDLELLQAIAEVLLQRGYDVVKARNGDELIAALAASPFDLVVTDVSMPWMTGLQAAHSARYAGLQSPILVISALDDPTLPAKVASLDEHAHLLRKPFDLSTLEDAVDKMLGSLPSQEPTTCG